MPQLAVAPMYPFRTTKLARDLKICPYGHHALKDIPIMYGLPDFSGSNRAIWEEKIRNHEIVLGGCVVMPDSPKVDTTCLTCGFVYSQRDDSWFRSSEDPDSFHPRISDLLRSIMPAGIEERYFAVSVEHDGSASESASVDSSLALADLKTYMVSWIERSGLQARPEHQHAPTIRIDDEWFISGADRDWSLSIRQRYGGKGSTLYFSKQIEKANQALQHNDPSCHESCLRTPRASRGRG